MKSRGDRYVKKIANALRLPPSQRPEIVFKADDEIDEGYQGEVYFKDGHYIVALRQSLEAEDAQSAIRHELGHIKADPKVYPHWDDDINNRCSDVANRELSARIYEDELAGREITRETLYQWFCQIHIEFPTITKLKLLNYLYRVARERKIKIKTITQAMRMARKGW